MSNEMMIQDSRPSAMPYLLGGATVGSLGGMYASNKIPYFAGKKMNISDIIKEVKNDKFEASTKVSEKTLGKKKAKLWQTLKDKVTNLKKHQGLAINDKDYTKARSEYKNALRDVQKNCKVGGKMKWLLPVVGAFTLGLAALGFRTKAKEV